MSEILDKEAARDNLSPEACIANVNKDDKGKRDPISDDWIMLCSRRKCAQGEGKYANIDIEMKPEIEVKWQILHKSINADVYLNGKAELGVNDDPVHSQCVEVIVKEDIDINEERNHIRTHTEEKQYQCSQCGKVCSKISHLKRHMRTHTGEKPYKCSICSKCFSQNTNLVRHQTTHTGEKAYHCSHCDKAYYQNS
ncbi:unnamed protein product, partial [Meganyctiphanes norvegica]